MAEVVLMEEIPADAAYPSYEDRRRATMVVPYGLLRGLLRLPESCMILKAEDTSRLGGELRLTILSPDFPPVPNGDPIPVANPLFISERRSGNFSYVTFHGWGL